MADTIKNGSFEVTSFKVGNADCKIYLGDTLLYPHSTPPTVKNYFSFVAIESGTFTFTGNDIDYSLDSGSTWTTLSNGTATPTITAGSVIMWKASGLTINSTNGIGTFSSTGRFSVGGNAMSLHFGDDFEGKTSLSGKDHALRNLFLGCTTLTNIDNMSLPATTLSTSCYRAMFSGCTSLTSLENLVLPATTLSELCYFAMFQWCTSLTTVPKNLLPATNLSGATQCYCNMFSRCTSLKNAPDLPATTLSVGCYYNMFYSGTSLTVAPDLPAETLLQDSYRQMFYSCQNLRYIKCLATSKTASNCTAGWTTNITTTGIFHRASGVSWTTGSNGIPTKWANRVYNSYDNQYLTFTATESGTFKLSGETAANTVSYSLDSGATWTSLANNTNTPTISAGSKIMWKASGLTIGTSDGIGRFSSTGNFTVEGNPMSLHFGDEFIGQASLSGKDNAFRALFWGCTKMTNADNIKLPSITLATRCYQNFFNSCSSLTTLPDDLLPATTLANYCYCNMFIGCKGLTDVSSFKLPSTTLSTGCYQGMFAQCSNLEKAPVLSAATLQRECYIYMLQSSPKVNWIKCLATSISATNCTRNWVSGVSASGTFVKASSMTSWTTGNSGIPSGWTVTDA